MGLSIDIQKQENEIDRRQRVVKRKIPFLPFFWPCHKQPFYNKKENLPVTESIAERGFSVPCNSMITEQEAVELANIIGNVVKNA